MEGQIIGQYLENYRRLACRLNTHNTASVGATLFIPALGLLLNQSYAETLFSHFFPHVSTAFVPLGGGFIVGLAGYILYLARPHNITQGQAK